MSIFTEFPEALYPRQNPPPAATPGTPFDLGTARTLAWAAQLAYETNDPAKVRRVLASWGWACRGLHAGRVNTLLPLTSARGFVAGCGTATILAFAGTDPVNPGDWIKDLSIRVNATGLHDGFESGIAAVWDTIAPLLGSGGAAAGGRLFIVGHSLGGALAVVAAQRLVRSGVVAPDRIAGVYTLGCPRVGDARFAQYYCAAGEGGLADRTVRLVQGDDIVPRLPPAEAPFGFRHVGRLLACAHGAPFDPARLAPDTPEQPPDGSALPGLVKSLFHLPGLEDLPRFPGSPVAAALIEALSPAIRDHLMDRYLRALGGL